MRKDSWFVVAGVGAVALAVISGPLDAQARYTSDMRISTSKEPVVKPPPLRIDVKGNDTTIVIKPPMPVPPFRLADYVGLSEPQITNYMATRDSAQLGLARLGQQKATDPAVRDLAAHIELQRTEDLNETIEIITDEGVGFEARQGDYALARLVEAIRALNSRPAGADWDLAYLRTQFFLHEQDVQVMSNNVANAHDNDLEYHMKESMQRSKFTRDVARSLAAARGMTLP